MCLKVDGVINRLEDLSTWSLIATGTVYANMKPRESEVRESLVTMGPGENGDRRLSDDCRSSEKESYGCLCFKPRGLQLFNTIQCHVFWQCVFCFVEGFMVNGVISVVIPALEKRFSLSSAESGLVASSNDFGAIVCGVFVGYLGEHRHKPRLIAAGILLMALGSLVFSLPHFIGENYHFVVSGTGLENDTNMCSGGDNWTRQADNSTAQVADNTVYYCLLLLGNILLGIGASPMFSLGLSYIDENCKPKLSSFYIGCTFAANAVGVAAGYVVGGQTLGLYVDVNREDIDSVTLTPADPQWVGAWWMGAVVSIGGMFLVAIPMAGFPKRLPKYEEVQKYRKSEAHRGGHDVTTNPDFGKSLKDFPKAIFYLVTNPTYICVTLGGTADALLVAGMASFGTKLIQERFNTDLPTAGTILGIIVVPGSGGGMFLGGYLVKKFQLKCRGLLRLCAAFTFFGLVLGAFLLAQCPGDPLAGVSVPYTDSPAGSGLVSDCNRDCGCTARGFEPVCGGGTLYFSPCHAGCRDRRSEDGKLVYYSCSCVQETGLMAVKNNTSFPTDVTSRVIPGLCSGRCVWLYVFCGLFLVVMVTTFCSSTPAVTALFRCVPDNQRSLAIAANIVFVRLAGTTPGPLLLGAIIDSSCTLWQDTCGTRGTCWVYNKHAMGVRILLWFLTMKTAGCLSYLLGSWVYTPPPSAGSKEELSGTHSGALQSVTGKMENSPELSTLDKEFTKL